jgi:hypothetical protein
VRNTTIAQADARELAGFTPAFLWLLRDFYLRLEDEAGHTVCALVCVYVCLCASAFAAVCAEW